MRLIRSSFIFIFLMNAFRACALLLPLALVFTPYYIHADENTEQTIEEQDPAELDPYSNLQVFGDVFQEVLRSYVKEPSSKEMVENALKGMLRGLDPHSTYMTKKEFALLQKQLSGYFIGIGVKIKVKENDDKQQVEILELIEGGGAKDAGILPKDVIVSVDDKPLENGVKQAVSLLQGEEGTKVSVTVKRKDQLKTFLITRKKIRAQSTNLKIYDKHFLYIQVESFNEGIVKEIKDTITKKSYDLNEIRGIILDLRNNGGGLLSEAVALTNLFVDMGEIVRVKGRDNVTIGTHFATPDVMIDLKVPMLVMVNENSASASEVVSAALKDLSRAIIVGRKTFGKGSVQNIIPISNGDRGGIKITTSFYYTPSGKSIQALGINPNIDLVKREGKVYSESSNENHLKNPQDLGAYHNDKESDKNKKGKEYDWEIEKTLEILRSIHQTNNPY